MRHVPPPSGEGFVAELRVVRGISRRRLSEKLGISTQHLLNVESRGHSTTIVRAEQWAKALTELAPDFPPITLGDFLAAIAAQRQALQDDLQRAS